MPSTNTGSLISQEEFSAFVADVKDFRVQIDAAIQRSEKWLNTPQRYGQHEMSLVRTKLQEAKMWAGKILEAAGNPFPVELADKAPGQ
jgi:hypothetical protein